MIMTKFMQLVREMRNAYYDYLGKLWRTADQSVPMKYITHWMPIPELLKGGEV